MSRAHPLEIMAAILVVAILTAGLLDVAGSADLPAQQALQEAQ
jgi:type II secretory pathway pseudopilin PulG